MYLSTHSNLVCVKKDVFDESIHVCVVCVCVVMSRYIVVLIPAYIRRGHAEKIEIKIRISLQMFASQPLCRGQDQPATRGKDRQHMHLPPRHSDLLDRNRAAV